MDDYISRADVLKERQTFAALGIPDLVDAVLIEDIETIPAADVRPVVRGEWIVCDDYKSVSKRRRETHVITWMCSKCFAKNGRRKTNFCPNCGADMTGGADNG